MLADVAAAHPITYGVLRYFNVAGADPQKRSGQSTPLATHLIKVAAQTALGQRDQMDIFGTDYPTPDGTGVRDYIHVTDLIEAHALLLDYLRDGGDSVDAQLRLRAGLFGAAGDRHGASQVSGVEFEVDEGPRRAGDPASVVADGEQGARDARLGAGARRPRARSSSSALDWERYLATRNR